MSRGARREHPRQGLEQLALRRRPQRGLGQDQGEAAPEQRIPKRLGGKLYREGNEPGRLAGAGTGPCHGRKLLEEGQEKGGLRSELAVDRTLREARGRRYVVEGCQGEPMLGEDPETRLEQQGSCFGFAP